jgi:hypothetical protein
MGKTRKTNTTVLRNSKKIPVPVSCFITPATISIKVVIPANPPEADKSRGSTGSPP